MRVIAFVMLGIVAASAMVAAEEADAKGAGSTILTSDNLSKIDEGVWLLKLYAPWCGHCKRLAPTWEELGDAAAAVDGLNVGKVDCTAEKDICSAFGVRGYPTVIAYHAGYVYKYNGKRELDSLLEFGQGGYEKVKAEKGPDLSDFGVEHPAL